MAGAVVFRSSVHPQRAYAALFSLTYGAFFLMSGCHAETHPGHRAQHTTALWRHHGRSVPKQLTYDPASLVSNQGAIRHRKRGGIWKHKPKLTQLHNEVTEYIGKIGIGTDSSGDDPQAEVRVVFDTGSTNLWAASTLCDTSPCTDKGRNRFNSDESQTFQKPPHGGIPLDIKFGTGELRGPLGMDTFRFGPFKVENQTFAMIQRERGAVFAEIPFEGILGLAFPSMSAHHVTPFFDSVIQQGVLKKNEFSFYLNQHDDRPSALLWGGVDPALYVGQIEMFPVTQPHYWSLDLYDFKIGSKSYKHFQSPLSIDEDRFADMNPFGGSGRHVKKLIVDSGTTYFTAPGGLKEVIVDRLPRAPCSEVEKNPEKYPDLSFVLRNKEGEQFELKVGQVTYMVEETPGNCAPGFMEINVKEEFGPAMILGELFMRHHFTVFSRGNTDEEARIGFAKSKLGAIPTALKDQPSELDTQDDSPAAKAVDTFPHLPADDSVAAYESKDPDDNDSNNPDSPPEKTPQPWDPLFTEQGPGSLTEVSPSGQISSHVQKASALKSKRGGNKEQRSVAIPASGAETGSASSLMRRSG